MAGLSQDGLAERCDLSRSYINMIERGERKLSPEALTKIKFVFAEEGLHDTEILFVKTIMQASNLNKNRKGL